MSAPIVGTLRALLRYPVKSMQGEALVAAQVLAEHGIHGDRGYAVQDRETGRIASAKHPRRFAALLACHARVRDPLAAGQRRGPVAITLPGGRTLGSDHPDLDAALSAALARPVQLVDAPPPQAEYDELGPGELAARRVPLAVGAQAGTFFDFAPIHIVTTASLARLAELAPASQFAIERFRPNLVIASDDPPGFIEHRWLGQVLAVGDEVRLCVTFPCPRCVMATLAQGSLPADPEVLRTAARHNPQLFALLARKVPSVGVYASVLRGGTIRSGDPVRLAGPAPLQRAAAFLHAIKRAMHRR